LSQSPDEPWIQERLDHPLGGGKHTFTISVVVRGDGCDYDNSSDPYTVTEQAYSLNDALKQAVKRPFKDWCATEVTAVREEDHAEALALDEAIRNIQPYIDTDDDTPFTRQLETGAHSGATCAHCGHEALGYATVTNPVTGKSVRVCHHETRDCYKDVTVRGVRLRAASGWNGYKEQGPRE
jgi:hypothetical protein